MLQAWTRRSSKRALNRTMHGTSSDLVESISELDRVIRQKEGIFENKML